PERQPPDQRGCQQECRHLRKGAFEHASSAPLPAVLVDADGVVRWIFQSETYRDRARADEIFAAIAELRDTG
ncbi:MAG: hypothetical protein GY946_22635, partial [bacterium]|nr:hypothetical protein [bacterium]